MSTEPTIQRGATAQPSVGRQDPVGDTVVDFLFAKNRETAELDFKWTIDLGKGSDFARFAKDIFAFSNYGGGHVFFGIKENKKGQLPNYGLPEDYHLDQADLQQKFNAYASEPIVVHYRAFKRMIGGMERRLAIVYVTPSTSVLVPTQDGRYVDAKGKDKFAFRKGEVLFRRGTQSILASPKEKAWIERRAQAAGYQLSVLSGQPDVVEETLLSDLFPVTRLPAQVFVAELDKRPPQEALALTDYMYLKPYFYGFTNPSDSPIVDFIRGMVQVVATKDWVRNPDNARLMTWMLGDLLQTQATIRGISVQRKPRKLYYRMGRDVKERSVTWRGPRVPAPPLEHGPSLPACCTADRNWNVQG